MTPVSAETRSELDVPIRVGGEIWGALSVQSTHVDAFDEEDARLVAAVADRPRARAARRSLDSVGCAGS